MKLFIDVRLSLPVVGQSTRGHLTTLFEKIGRGGVWPLGWIGLHITGGLASHIALL